MDENENRQACSEKQQPSASERRKWHAPKLSVVGLAATLTQGNAGNDGAPKFSPMLS